MKAGEVVKVKRNAELLNNLLGTNYEQWYKSYLHLDQNIMIWMARLDNKVRDGWRNRLENGKIIEEYLDTTNPPSNILVGAETKRRIAFIKYKDHFRFIGVYEYDATNSTPKNVLPIHRELVKISDTYDF